MQVLTVEFVGEHSYGRWYVRFLVNNTFRRIPVRLRFYIAKKVARAGAETSSKQVEVLQSQTV